MANDEGVSLDNLRNLTKVLERLPQGPQARALAEKLGLWSTATHNAVDQRRKEFPTNFSRLTDSGLSDEYAYWLAEVFRVTELNGVFEGQKVLLNLKAKSARASARASLRRTHQAEADKLEVGAKPKTITATQLADEVEENIGVQDIDETIGLLAVVQESAKAYKEACLAATAGLSREISYRQAQMGARLR